MVEDRAVIQAIAHMMAINEGAPELDSDLVPAANYAYRQAMEGNAVAQRLVDMANAILPEVVLRLADASSLENIKGALPHATVSVFGAGAGGRLCSQLVKKMEAVRENKSLQCCRTLSDSAQGASAPHKSKIACHFSTGKAIKQAAE